jgi:hypothetical protein
MLRESSKNQEADFDLSGVTGGVADDGDIPQATLLASFAEAVVERDADKLIGLRDKVKSALGEAALVDVAATAAAFHGFVRVADSTGIPYSGAAGGQDSTDLRAQVGIDQFYAVQLGDRH